MNQHDPLVMQPHFGVVTWVPAGHWVAGTTYMGVCVEGWVLLEEGPAR